ncbi:hypothetical protein ACROYT_G014245 [Oculina patagonica]
MNDEGRYNTLPHVDLITPGQWNCFVNNCQICMVDFDQPCQDQDADAVIPLLKELLVGKDSEESNDNNEEYSQQDEEQTDLHKQTKTKRGEIFQLTNQSKQHQSAKEDISKVMHQDVHTWICCPDILNIAVNPFLTCNNKDCKRKIAATLGLQIAKCHNCNRSILVKNCYVDMIVSCSLEKDGKQCSLTAFSKAISTFLNEDIFSFKDNTEPLETKLLQAV